MLATSGQISALSVVRLPCWRWKKTSEVAVETQMMELLLLRSHALTCWLLFSLCALLHNERCGQRKFRIPSGAILEVLSVNCSQCVSMRPGSTHLYDVLCRAVFREKSAPAIY